MERVGFIFGAAKTTCCTLGPLNPLVADVWASGDRSRSQLYIGFNARFCRNSRADLVWLVLDNFRLQLDALKLNADNVKIFEDDLSGAVQRLRGVFCDANDESVKDF